ncbi:MAG: beta-ketoacyl-ACP synthase II [candidate division Zixibacteria bacterium]|nr:beta-ketoacyl-ACP synthase II [candidate division Zixibacteria bacterium]
MNNGRRRVVVTGMGALTALGLTMTETWEGLLAGKSGAGKITKFDTEVPPPTPGEQPQQLITRIAAEVKGFNPDNYMPAKEAKRIDIHHQYALAACVEAFEDAGLKEGDYVPERSGCVIGTTNGGGQTFLENYKVGFNKGLRFVSPFKLQMMFCDMAPSLISIKYNLMGPNYVTVSTCASGTHAIGNCFRNIQYNEADLMVTGGSEAPINLEGVAGYCRYKALTQRNDEPEKASRPFDKDRDGFLLGEGSAIMILEELEHAKKRGAKIYAEVVGYGMSSDAYHITAPHPEGKGAAMGMTNAINDAGIKPEDIDYMNSHGTATPLGDPAETKAIKLTFGEHAYKLKINSTKSMIGHLIGAAGAAEAVVTAKAVKEGKIHPTINLDNPDPECDLDYTAHKGIDYDIKYAIKNSAGFGGHNAALVFKKYEE